MLKLLDSDKSFLRHISDYKDLKIESELESGDKTLSFSYRGKSTDIQNEQYIVTLTDRFTVKEVSPEDNNTVYVCKLDLESLEAGMFYQFTAVDKTCQEAAQLALAGTGWTVNIDPDLSEKRRSVQQFKKTPLECLYKIRDAFMCELRFDSIRQVVYFAQEFGEDRGVYLRPELNLVSLSPTFDSYDYYTRIIPFGKDGLTISSVNDGKNYVENYQYSDKVRTLIWEDTSYEDPQDLKDDAEGKLHDLSRPKRSYSAKVRDLAKLSPDYGILSFSLGDTVHIVDEPKGIMDDQRIVKIIEYPDHPEENEVEISNTVLSWEELQAKMKAAADAWEDISNADGSVNGVYVHGVQAGDVVGIEVVVNDGIESSSTINALNVQVAEDGRNISSLQTGYAAVVQDLTAVTARVGSIETNYLSAEVAALQYATIGALDALSGDFHTLDADYADFKTATATELLAVHAIVDNLDATYLRVADARITYAQIDLANVQAGSVKTAMIDTGAVQTAQIADGSITDAKIVGLTASKITAGTLNAGVIDVINQNADNITVGTLNGQRIADGAISSSKLSQELSDTIDSAVANTQVLYALGNSASSAPVSGWSETAPTWEDGKYMWQKTVLTLSDGTIVEKPATSISGATGADGEDATILRIDSSRGTVFKNSNFGTIFTVVIWKGPLQITDITALRAEYGNGAYLEWKWRRIEDTDFQTISVSDSRITRDGFQFEITPADVDEKIVFQCNLNI